MKYLVIGLVFFTLGSGTYFIVQHLNPQAFTAMYRTTAGQPKPEGKLRNDMRPFYGVVTKQNGNSFEVKNRDSSVVTVEIASTTKISKGERADIKIDQKVSGVGKLNQDETITAATIQINPNSALNSL